MPASKVSKKNQVLLRLLEWCQANGTNTFHNDLVKVISREVGFGNPFDATKLDNEALLPDELRRLNLAVIHLGKGNHAFVEGTQAVYHAFEPVVNVVDWPYRRSLLNGYNTSESNTLSVANNQRILHDFAFGFDAEFSSDDIARRAKTYFPHRTKRQLTYQIGVHSVDDILQIEVDLTIEFAGRVAVFEGKNGVPNSFNVFQLYHPFLYYHLANEGDERVRGQIRAIEGIYVIRGGSTIRLWAYTFARPLDPTSITFVRATAHRLIPVE